MYRRTLRATAIALALFADAASAQTVQDLAGTWAMVSNDSVNADGSRAATFGPNAKGQLILTAAGQFSQIFVRPDLPKFASNNRLKGTPEENAAVVQGSYASFGSWSIIDKVVTLKMDGATFPNWTGTTQTRALSAVSADEIKWTLAQGTAGGTVETVWKRVK